MNPVSSLLPPLITGMGAYSAGGCDLPLLWENTLKGHVAATLETFSQLHHPVSVYRAPSPTFTGQERARLRDADRTVHLALAAAQEAWNSANLEIGQIPSERLGVIIGSARGPVTLQEKYASSSMDKTSLIKPSTSLYTTFFSLAGLVAKAFKAEGPSFMVSSSCTSGATALHAALGMIKSGLLDVVIVGGVEAPLVGTLLQQYAQTDILSHKQPTEKALAPFDQDRSGTLLGEGAAFVILESSTFAKKRRASILGCLEAVSITTQSRHRAGFNDEGRSLEKILHQSLHEASLLPRDIELVHLHGTGTRLNDFLESAAVNAVFGSPETQPLIAATKAITGHTLGAAALFQVVLTLCSLQKGIVPAITNCAQPDPTCSLRLALQNTSLSSSSSQRTGICLTAGFWGNVASIILST